MDDLISRRVAIDAITEEIELNNLALSSVTLDYNTKERLRQRNGQAKEDVKTIGKISSAQRTGTWLVAKGARERDYMECNQCRWIFAYYGGLEEEWNYCPHCGARMERE